MKVIIIFLSCFLTGAEVLRSQPTIPDSKQRQEFESVINKYSDAREKRDTVLLRNILTSEVDQLVSNGEWRIGIDASVQGMLNSSASIPGRRTLTIKRIRLLAANTSVVDCKYDIQNADGTSRGMWSTFIMVLEEGTWKISAIRNMLPSTP